MVRNTFKLGSGLCALMLAGCDGGIASGTEHSLHRADLDDGLINVTLNKPATASHVQQSPYFPPEKAVDGNITADDSRWCTGEYITAPRYLDVDLQGTFDLHRMELYTGFRDERAIASYAVLYDNGSGWQPIPGATQTGNTSVAVSTTFTQVVTANRVRFLCNEPSNQNCRLKELWVFGTPSTAPTNQPPVANAGADQSVTLPNSSITLTGTGTDSDGSIAAYAWTKVSGPAVTLAGASSAQLLVSGLSPGQFVFRLTVTDDQGATHSDDVTVTVADPMVLTNVTRLKPASAVNANGSFLAPQGVDDNLNTRWESGYMELPGAFFDVDLQGHYELHSAELHLSTGAQYAYAMKDFELQAWTGGCWQTIPGSVVTNNPANSTVRNLTFTTPVVASKVRLVCKDTQYCRLRELKVMGRPANAPTGPMTCSAGEQIAVRSPRYSYALFLPAAYNADRDARWPLIIALHGTGGSTLTDDHQTVHSNPEGLANRFLSSSVRASFGGIVVSPHWRKLGQTGQAWFNHGRVMALLEDVKKDYLVDTDRVYFTGFSGGANTLFEQPGIPSHVEKVAAFVPIAATNTPSNVTNICNLKHLPIWAFNGQNDSQSPPSSSTALKNKLDTQCGTGPSAMRTPTSYPGVGHSSQLWQNVYSTPELYDWLFQQRISDRL